MRPLAWVLFGGLALACGGSAFTSGEDGGAGGSAGSSGSGRGGNDRGGASNSAGKASVAGGGHGGTSGEGERPGASGSGGAHGGTGGAAAGEPGVSGSAPVAGEAGTGGGGSEPIDDTCPETSEGLGERCKVGLVCTFGEDIRTRCRPQATCPQGKWQVGAKLCDPLPACNQVIVGKECDGSVPECSLASGVYCACTLCPGSGPCGQQPVWACAGGSGGAGCPVVPPNVGAKCAGNAGCSYGSCGTDNSLVATCDGSSWRWETGVCPK